MDGLSILALVILAITTIALVAIVFGKDALASQAIGVMSDALKLLAERSKSEALKPDGQHVNKPCSQTHNLPNRSNT